MDPTQRVPLGTTSLSVTRLGLGTVPIGGLYEEVSDETAYATVRRTWDAGVRLYDTAPVYGYGRAEERLGRVLAQYPRDAYVLASKVGRLLRADAPLDPTQLRDGQTLYKGTPPVNPVFDFSYDGAMRSVEESLGRLGLDRIDILHIHDPDNHYDEALAGAYVALDKLRSEGVIRAVGAGMNQTAMLARFAREGDFNCFLLAGRYTLLEQGGLDDLLPLCVEKRISIVIGGVYNSGILANAGSSTYNYSRANPAILARVQRLREVCERHNTPLAAAAIQFPLGHPAVTTILTGVRSPAEMDENERMFRFPIPPDLWQELRAEGLLDPRAPVPGETAA